SASMAQVDPLVRDVLPDVADAMRASLAGDGEDELAAGVDGLRIVAPCACGDDFCGSFYTESRPQGGWGPGHRNVEIDLQSDTGSMVILDVVDDRITYVEVLSWDAVRDRVAHLFASP